ncbi:MAG: Gfo/Idh/MocA family oxidoreductase [Chloroflexota bacterium]|nr:Gfo/Idh/MocA family oxidoreductase [Chloroflexota bacterium]
MVDKIGVAIVGCGNIAGPYAKDIMTYPELDLRGVSDLDMAKAQAFAAEHGTQVYDSLEALLADPTVAIVVNLTIHHAHKDVITQCIHAGKHVFSEKPLALNYADAKGLVALADEKGVRLGCAPTTLLGEAQQTAWQHIRAGKLGTVRVCYAEVNWGRIESWHPNPVPFYDIGVLPDVGVYPLTILTSMFGPVRRVTAYSQLLYPDRVTKEGVPFSITTPDMVIALLEHESGVLTRMTCDFYISSQNTRQNGIEFHGDAGSLLMESWLAFNSKLFTSNFGEEMAELPLLRPQEEYIRWGRGLHDMALAIRDGRPHRMRGEIAAHICEILEATKRAAATQTPVQVESSFAPPAPMGFASA